MCVDCGQPVCGDCSERRNDRRVCRQHGKDARREADAAAQREREARLSPLKNIENPVECLLYGIVLLARVYPEGFLDRQWRLPDEPEFAALCEDRGCLRLLTDAERTSARKGQIVEAAMMQGSERWLGWDGEQIAEWFARTTSEPPDVVVPLLRRGRRDTTKKDGKVEGWVVPQAHRFPHGRSVDAIILADGRLLGGRQHGFGAVSRYEQKHHPERVANTAPRVPARGFLGIQTLLPLAQRAGLSGKSGREQN